MIISISGVAGSGKSTIAKLLAKKLDYNHFSAGKIMREMADDRGVSLPELNKLAEETTIIDEELDNKQAQLGREEDNFVIDGRLSFRFIPHSFKVFLIADFEERAKRVYHEKRGYEDNVTLDKTKDNFKIREDSDKKRYKEYYDLNITDKDHYDLIIDTTSILPDEIVEILLEKLKE